MIGAFAKIVQNITKIMSNKTDGANQAVLDNIREGRDTDKAMEAAEKHMFAVASYLSGDTDKDDLKKSHKKYSTRYFKYN